MMSVKNMILKVTKEILPRNKENISSNYFPARIAQAHVM